jgi:hypothetical protein
MIPWGISFVSAAKAVQRRGLEQPAGPCCRPKANWRSTPESRDRGALLEDQLGFIVLIAASVLTIIASLAIPKWAMLTYLANLADMPSWLGHGRANPPSSAAAPPNPRCSTDGYLATVVLPHGLASPEKARAGGTRAEVVHLITRNDLR